MFILAENLTNLEPQTHTRLSIVCRCVLMYFTMIKLPLEKQNLLDIFQQLLEVAFKRAMLTSRAWKDYYIHIDC
jgi:hypothetical protein